MDIYIYIYTVYAYRYTKVERIWVLIPMSDMCSFLVKRLFSQKDIFLSRNRFSTTEGGQFVCNIVISYLICKIVILYM